MQGCIQRALAAVVATVLLLTMSATAQAGEKPLPPGTTRMAGDDRYDTSAAVSAKSFTAPVDAVFIATGGVYADALAGGPAAAHHDGPVLLVRRDQVPASVKAELTRLKPATIYLLGGSSVISTQVANELRGYAGTVKRLAGDNRYGTAVAVSQNSWSTSSTVMLASGAGFADALSGGSAAAQQDAPLLLTATGSLTAVTRSELIRLKPNRVFVLGGKSAVSDATLTAVRNAVPSANVSRVAGEDRYATSAAVARKIWPQGASTAFFANGNSYPDALSGTPAAAVNSAPLLLTKRECLPAAVYAVRADFGVARTGILGGTQTLTNAGATQECGVYRYSGHGDEVLKITKPGGLANPALVTLTHNGSSNFIVQPLNSDLEVTDLLVNEIGNYKGRVLLDPHEFGQVRASTHLEIIADGAWTVMIQPISSARSMSPNKTTGAGDEVLRWSGSPVTARFTHNGSSNFIILARESDGEWLKLLINVIGTYNGNVAVPVHTRLVTINADGGWSITVG